MKLSGLATPFWIKVAIRHVCELGKGGGVPEKDKAAKLESIMLRMHNRFTQLYTSN